MPTKWHRNDCSESSKASWHVGLADKASASGAGDRVTWPRAQGGHEDVAAKPHNHTHQHTQTQTHPQTVSTHSTHPKTTTERVIHLFVLTAQARRSVIIVLVSSK